MLRLSLAVGAVAGAVATVGGWSTFTDTRAHPGEWTVMVGLWGLALAGLGGGACVLAVTAFALARPRGGPAAVLAIVTGAVELPLAYLVFVPEQALGLLLGLLGVVTIVAAAVRLSGAERRASDRV